MDQKRQKPAVRYYVVDDVPVCIWSNGDEAYGFVMTTGYPYPVLKAISEGRETSLSRLVLEEKQNERRAT